MGRRGHISGASRFMQPIFHIKFRRPGDRIDSNGTKTEGGQILSRHFGANNYDHAKTRANSFAKKNGLRVISIGLVHPDDVRGDHNRWGLEKIIGIPVNAKERRDAIVDNVSLEELMFGKKNGHNHNNKF